MWKQEAICRYNRYCPQAVRRGREFLVQLIFDFHGGGDPLPCENARMMTLGTAKRILSEEAVKAAASGRQVMLVRLLGGDPFKRFEELGQLCQWAWGNLKNPRVEFELTSTFSPDNQEQLWWYLDNREKIRLWLRCDHLDKAIQDFAVKSGCGLEYRVEPIRAVEAYEDIARILDSRIRLRIRRDIDPRGWSKEEHSNYTRLLEKLTLHQYAQELPWADRLRDLMADDLDMALWDFDLSGRCYDTNGYVWTCPALSHLRLHSWSMDQQALDRIFEAEPMIALDWLCPGETLRMGDAVNQLRSIQALELRSAILATAKHADEAYSRTIKGMLLEKEAAAGGKSK